MADTKISALTASTTPLAGTEVLPIVQGGVTKQVSVANLTAGRAPSVSGLTVSGLTASTALALNASKELVSVTNTGTGDNVLATTPTLAGNVTLSTGNLVIGTSGQGIDFSATPGTGTSELLSDYEEGIWTPSIGGNAGGVSTLSVAYGDYTRVGRQVTVRGRIEFSLSTLSGGVIYMAGLPFTSNSTANSNTAGTLIPENITYLGQLYGFINPNSAFIYFLTGTTATGAGTLDGGAFGSTSKATFAITYFV
jgi:hypothetical protein